MMYTMMPFGRRNDSLVNLFDQMERSLWRDNSSAVFSFPTDIKEEENQFVLTAELPGFRKEEIQLHLDNSVLTIHAQHQQAETEKNEKEHYICRERHDGSYQRSFTVTGIQENAIAASYENGVLKLILPKDIPVVPAARQINIQ